MLITPTAPLWVAARALLVERKDDLDLRWQRARKTYDPEDIHDLRVSSRRMRETLALFSPCFQAKSLSRISSRIKRLTQLLGTMRNTDEALLFFRGLASSRQADEKSALPSLLMQLEDERIKEQKTLATGFKKLNPGPVNAQLQSLFKRPIVFCNTRVDPFRPVVEFGREKIGEREITVRELLSHACREDDVPSQHRLRIATKRLRYRFETLIPLVREGHEELLDIVKAYQDILGKMHDLDVFADMVMMRVPDVTAQAQLIEEISQRRHDHFATFIGMLEKNSLDMLGERMRRLL